MFGSLSGDKLGIWVAHGEGKFSFPYELDKYNVIAQYSYDAYPANPNGSPCAVAGIASAVLGNMADKFGIEAVYNVCAYMPLLGLVTWFLPDLKKNRK